VPGTPAKDQTARTPAETIPLGALLRRLAGLAWRHRWVALPSAVLTIFLQGVTLAMFGGQGLAIDLVRRQVDPAAPLPHWPTWMTPPGSWSFMHTLTALALGVLGLSLLNAWARYALRVADERFVQTCVSDLRVRLYDKLQRLAFTWFDTHDTGQVINRITGDTQAVRGFIQGVMVRSVVAVVTLVVFLGFMLSTHTGLTLACLALVPVQVVAMYVYARKTKPLFLEQSRLTDRLVKSLQESIAGVRVIRAFGQEKRRLELFDERSAAARDQRIGIARDQGNFQPLTQACGEWTLAILLLYGGWLVLKGPEEGGIALGTLWVFRGLLGHLAGQLQAILEIIASGPEALAGAERVFRLLDERVTIGKAGDRAGWHAHVRVSMSGERAEDDERELKKHAHASVSMPPVAQTSLGVPPAVRGAVEFRNVTFAYPARSSQADDSGSHATGSLDRAALVDVSFRVEAGETVAVVGPTGGGKSTLLSLISRFHDPQIGHVFIDGVDAREWPVHELRRSVGVVFQEPFLFSNSIRNNVAYGMPDAPEGAILDAISAAEAADVVREAPQGLDTVIGERGVSLSGGQRQRLTIARALLLRPPILILDDATGSVDAITESSIQRALDRYTKGCTTFIVAHRLSTLRRADRVIVLEKGRVVDIGTHDELMNRAGHYRAAALIQLALDDDTEEAAA
jgi:ATP-binding cassette subfamily B protein